MALYLSRSLPGVAKDEVEKAVDSDETGGGMILRRLLMDKKATDADFAETE